MKNRCFILVLLSLLSFCKIADAQSTEAQQLLLNVEKLSQLKNILSDMKKGYMVVSNGYQGVQHIAEGNFSIHEVFLDGLMAVSPEVRKYRRVADIIAAQKDLVIEYKSALKRFSGSDLFDAGEMDYLSSVYGSLAKGSLDNLDELTMVITSSKLRMNDEERLHSIDRIFEDTLGKLDFLRSFNQQAGLLLLQRKRAKADLETTKTLVRKQ
ncbi:hypothetical protein DHW03_15450 [Pedobacter yonginense]|uniref:TerB family tellurite resistance protein n=1 Tax=Pedobacter yonginense TaxID=651869 RepID=A0A317EJB3_9SPHI|nr:hypothetical protein [Pedobacter yonginense]PWS26189.1 hypothetical protein DHW03_15450 [Pedobacter yonginense]